MLSGVVISSLSCDSDTICVAADFAAARGATCRGEPVRATTMQLEAQDAVTLFI